MGGSVIVTPAPAARNAPPQRAPSLQEYSLVQTPAVPDAVGGGGGETAPQYFLTILTKALHSELFDRRQEAGGQGDAVGQRDAATASPPPAASSPRLQLPEMLPSLVARGGGGGDVPSSSSMRPRFLQVIPLTAAHLAGDAGGGRGGDGEDPAEDDDHERDATARR